MKTAVVTGASGEIGLSITETLIKSGYFVVAQYNSNEQVLEDLRKKLEIDNLSDYLFCVKADFSKLDGYLKVVEVLNGFKHIDALVYTAGVSLYKEFAFTTKTELETLMNINFNSAYMLSSALVEKLSIKEKGKIIFISSIWGSVGASLESAYSASKFALNGLTKSLAKELAPKINVNCICPGVIDTKMNARFSKEEIDELINSTPKGRLGTAEEIANLTAFLISDKADFITGQIMTIDGGFTL